MSNELQLRPREQQGLIAAVPGTGYEETGPAQESIFKKIHRLLRGHYKWCIPAAVVLGAACGIAGYKSARPLWSSTGTVQVSSVISPLITRTPENAELPQQFKETQMALMRNQRVIDMAMRSDGWKQLGRDNTSDSALAEFVSQLKIGSAGRSDIITVTFTDEDPKAAVAGARGVVSAYNKLYVERAVQEVARKREALETRQMTLTSDMRTKRDNLQLIALRRYGTDDLRSIHAATVEYIAKIKSARDEGNIVLASMGAVAPSTQPVRQKKASEMTVEDIVATDQTMARLVQELDNLTFELTSVLSIGRFGERHAEVRGLRAQIDRKKHEIERYEKQWHARMDHSAEPFDLKDPSLLKRDQLETRQRLYDGLLKDAEREAQELGKEMFEMERLRKEIEHIDALVAETNRRLDQLRTEVQERITIISEGDRAMFMKDNKVQYAVAGCLGGSGFAIGLAMLISLMDRRFRTPDDARTTSKLTLLGVLPNLPENLADPEQAAIASHCVHQIRTLLQIASDRRVFVVTSPASGTGKTSLTLSLGVSFAAANCRTLLVDCDLVGGGLTARVDAIVRRKIGQILKQQGLVDDRQLQTALKLSDASRKKLGETLVALGHVNADHIARALALQEQVPMGVLDALHGEKLEDCVADSGIEGLSILPRGSAMPNDVSRLSPAMIRSLVDQARRHYDVVLIDTGPVPGSLEGSVVAACADAVVMVLSRGEQRDVAERSIQHLNDIGAHVAGVVFNRAENRDIDLSSTTSRVSSAGYNHSRKGQAEGAPGEPRMGPMALAVTSRAPASKNSSRPQE